MPTMVKALRILAGDPLPDLILLDIMMPGLSGLQVAEQLQQDARTRHIPSSSLTSMAAVESELQAGAGGRRLHHQSPSARRECWRGSKPRLLKAARRLSADQNDFSSRRSSAGSEVIAIQEVTIQAMASLAETATTKPATIFAGLSTTSLTGRAAARSPRFRHFLNDETIHLLFKSAPFGMTLVRSASPIISC